MTESDKITPKENLLETFFRNFAMMGGGWLAVGLIELFGKKIYECPNCYDEITYKSKTCPHCKVNINWKI